MLAQNLAESFPSDPYSGTGVPNAEAMMIVARRTPDRLMLATTSDPQQLTALVLA